MLLLDNSAWTRRWQPSVRDRFEAAILANECAVCLPFLLEAGYSARSARDHDTILADLTLLPHVSITSAVERHALDAQAKLVRIGHHRLSPADILIAAGAARS